MSLLYVVFRKVTHRSIALLYVVLCISVREEAERGVSITGPSTLSVVEGQTVELICTANGTVLSYMFHLIYNTSASLSMHI